MMHAVVWLGVGAQGRMVAWVTFTMMHAVAWSLGGAGVASAGANVLVPERNEVLLARHGAGLRRAQDHHRGTVGCLRETNFVTHGTDSTA